MTIRCGSPPTPWYQDYASNNQLAISTARNHAVEMELNFAVNDPANLKPNTFYTHNMAKWRGTV